MTLVPALFIFALELLLLLVGFGYPTGFFVRREVAGQDVFVENMDFGRTFFPRGLAREPVLPVAVTTVKAPDEYRIFVLGASAAMGFPDVSFSVSRILEAMLKNRYPNTQFAVVSRLKERLDAGGLDHVYSAYRSALERNAHDISIRKDFGCLLGSRGEFDEAIVQFLELKKQLPHHPAPCVFLARAYAAQGRHYDAIAECDEALRLRPGESQAIQLREEIQVALRQPN